MDKLNTLLLLAITALVALSIFMGNGGSYVGSVRVSDEYQFLQIGTFAGDADPAVLLRGAGGVLGQVVITEAGASNLIFYNATTSDVTLRAGATSTLSSIDIDGSAAEGTYIFDAVFTDGILMVTDGAVPTSTIMTR